MKLKNVFLFILILALVSTPLLVASDSFASTKGRCLLVASKQKQLALRKCSRFGGKKKKACVTSASAAFKAAAAKC